MPKAYLHRHTWHRCTLSHPPWALKATHSLHKQHLCSMLRTLWYSYGRQCFKGCGSFFSLASTKSVKFLPGWMFYITPVTNQDPRSCSSCPARQHLSLSTLQHSAGVRIGCCIVRQCGAALRHGLPALSSASAESVTAAALCWRAGWPLRCQAW